MKNRYTNYSLKEARKAVQWYKGNYGIDHSYLIGFYVPGDALDEFVNKLYNDGNSMGVNESALCIKPITK